MSFSKLQDLSAFVSVVQQGNFSSAAKKLGISTSAVTKGIARLEGELGVQLFNRSTRAITLTAHSREFYNRCLRILADLEEAESLIQDESSNAAGLVRIVMPRSFARGTLIPQLPRFFEMYPDIKLDIRFNSGGPLGPIKESFDLAVCTGDLDDSGLVRRILLRGPMVVVATPDYIAEHGAPSAPQDLAGHRCIIGDIGPDWEFRDGTKTFHVTVDGRVHLRGGGSYRETVLHGLGVGYSNRWLFRQDIASGALVSLLEHFTPDDVPVSVLYNDRRHVPKKVAAVMDFLTDITSAPSTDPTED